MRFSVGNLSYGGLLDDSRLIGPSQGGRWCLGSSIDVPNGRHRVRFGRQSLAGSGSDVDGLCIER